VGVGGGIPQPDSALFTAWIMTAMSTPPPLGTPCGHVEGCAVPRTMFTNLSTSPTVTSPAPLQSPTHTAFGVGLGDGVADGVTVVVGVLVGVTVGVGVGFRVSVGVGVFTGVGVSITVGVGV